MLPEPFRSLPRVQLMFDRPTDIEPLARLGAKINCPATLWMKREDCNSSLAFGGNKVRKLEYVLADAIAKGADTLITTGGIQSNHMRQTAAAAARLGLKVRYFPRKGCLFSIHSYIRLLRSRLLYILAMLLPQPRPSTTTRGTSKSVASWVPKPSPSAPPKKKSYRP